MNLNPVFVRTLGLASRSPGFFAGRSITAFLAAVIVLGCLSAGVIGAPRPPGPNLDRDILARIAAATLLGVAMALYLTGVSNRANTLLKRERDQDTLDALLLTRMTPLEIIWGFSAGALVADLSLPAVLFPFYLGAAVVVGHSAVFAILLFVAGLVTALPFATHIAQRDAAGKLKSRLTVAITIILVLWFFGPMLPATAKMISRPAPAAISTPLVFVIERLARNSPFNLALALAPPIPGLFSPGPPSVAATLACAVILAIVSTAASVRSMLPIREFRMPNLAEIEPARPSVEDDPVYWLDFGRFRRIHAHTGIVRVLRRIASNTIELFALVRRGLVLLGRLVLALVPLGLAIVIVVNFARLRSIALVLATAPGLRQVLHERLSAGVKLVCAAGFLFSNLLAISSIETQRRKGTWSLLLATPLSGKEIVDSEMRIWRKKMSVYYVALTVALVIAALAGAVHSACLPIAALFAWSSGRLSAIVSLRNQIRLDPERKPGRSMTSSPLSFLSFPGFLAATLWASSGKVLARYFLNPSLAVSLATAFASVASFAIPVAYLMVFKKTYEQASECFDEWQGRPTRKGQTPPAFATALAPSAQPAGKVLSPSA